MNMAELLAKIPDVIEIGSLALTSLTVFATVLARITPTKKDDVVVSKVSGWIWSFVKFAPTIGVNPNTKKLEKIEEAFKEVSEKPKEESDAQAA